MKIVTKLILLLTTYHLPLTTYSYSIFSSAGMGEPVELLNAQARGMGGVFNFKPYKDLTLECSMLFESIDVNGKANSFDFTVPYFRFLLPLPKSTTIDIGLNEILNLNFDLQDEWQEFAGDSVQHTVKGRGSASIATIGICKLLPHLAIEAGGFMVFGSSIEEWVTNFKRMNDACDTVNLKFYGTGVMGELLLGFDRFNIQGGYFSASNLTLENKLPHRFKASLFIRPVEKIKLSTGITQWQWARPFKPMHRVSIGGEVDFSGLAGIPCPPTLTLRGGFYTGNWYYDIWEYGTVQEKVGSVGVGIALKSLCQIDLAFEFGKRANSLLEEKIYRICLTIQGREII